MKRITLIHKLTICILAGLISAWAFNELFRKVFYGHINVISFISGGIFITSFFFAFFWHFKEVRQRINSLVVLSFFQALLCYAIAIDLSMFAWRKIFHLQFYAPQALLDKPVSSLTGQQLTIAYFGYSYPFAILLAVFQLTGGFLLLFKKTRLLGAFILIPVLGNIIMLDFFYDIEIGALFMAISLLFGLLYILYCYREIIFQFFFQSESKIHSFEFKNKFIKNVIRVSVIIIPALLCTKIYDFSNRHPEIYGKYEVKKLTVNGADVTAASCKDSVLTLLYLDENNDIVLEFNTQDTWKVGDFIFDKSTRKLKTIWRHPKNFKDTLNARLSEIKENKMTLKGTMGKDALEVELLKVK